MKILFYAPGMPPCAVGGAETLNHNTVSSLSKDHEVILVSNCNVPVGKSKLVHYKRIKPNKYTIPLRMIFTILKYGRKVDVFHITYARENPLLWRVFAFMKRIVKYNYVVYVMEGNVKTSLPRGNYLCLKKALNVITPGIDVSNSYENLLDRKVQTLPGVLEWGSSDKSKEELKKHFGFKEDSIIILWFARLHIDKHPEVLLEGFNQIDKGILKEKKVKLVYCGTGSEMEPLRQKAADYGLENTVVFTGFVSNEEKPMYYKLADAYVSCSHTESTVPFTMMEALHNKLPLVITEIPQFKQLLDAGAALPYPPYDAKALAAQLERIIIDESLRQQMPQNITPEIKEKYFQTTESFVNKLLEFYHE